MPVVEITPPVAARPWSWVSRLNRFQVRPPCARAVDADAGHWRQVDHHAAVDRRQPGHIVTAAADGDFELLLAGETDRIDDVGDAAAAGDQRRPLVDQAVVHLPRVLITGIARPKKSPVEGLAEFVDYVGQGRRRIHVSPPRLSALYTGTSSRTESG
jgi:hypothetical protein